jgi:AbrB family looped-hinge helix DNA binding protein
MHTNFYGVTTVGTKGQIVIPAEARDEMNLQPGEKVIIIGKRHPAKGFGMVCICPVSSAEQFLEEMTAHVTKTQAAIKQAKAYTDKET